MSKFRIGIGSNVFHSIEVEAPNELAAKEIAIRETTVEEPIVESVQEL